MSRITLGKLFSRALKTGEALSPHGGPLDFDLPLISYGIAVGKRERNFEFLSTKFLPKL